LQLFFGLQFFFYLNFFLYLRSERERGCTSDVFFGVGLERERCSTGELGVFSDIEMGWLWRLLIEGLSLSKRKMRVRDSEGEGHRWREGERERGREREKD
jgi:hypothetical protein